MNKYLSLIVIIIISFNHTLVAQKLDFKKVKLSDSIALSMEMKSLAQDFIKKKEKYNRKIQPKNLFRIEMLAGKFETSINTIHSLRNKSESNNEHFLYIQYETFAKAKIKQLSSNVNFQNSYQSVFKEYLLSCDDEKANSTHLVFTTYDKVSQFTNSFKKAYENIHQQEVTFEQGLKLLKAYFLYNIYSQTEPIIFKEIEEDEQRRYHIKEDLLIPTKDGAELSIITVRKKGLKPMPAVLVFTIYASTSNLNDAILAASKGYVGVVATSRGKRLSKSKIEPYKHEHKDVYTVIDWISKQNWSDGQVGMYGGSYNAFAQWASMKEQVHPALKTIVPSASAAPGIDVPMENNVFLNFSYSWIPYVTNNKYLDNATYFNRDRWENLQKKWFDTGKSYSKIDSIDGIPNSHFHEWISHPSYDQFWQDMIPYKREFSHINIPILTTTGYYDDGQRGAMYYYLEHIKYNPKADHYLLIGPYDHWGAQNVPSLNLRGYQIDEVARINIKNKLVFDWFDYILKGKEKPSILKDKVNFQVMGTNKWLSTSTFSEMSNDSLVYYLKKDLKDKNHRLVEDKMTGNSAIELVSDLADRTIENNSDYYPWPIEKDSISLNDGVVFMSKPFKDEAIINGSFSGELMLASNKKDFDFAVNLYELNQEGKYFHLSYYIGRASYAKNKEKRELLQPEKVTRLPFDNTRIISKKIAQGSRIVIIVNTNKNPYGQINYGTGKDVSKESLDDAISPLLLKIYPESKILIPTRKNK